MIGERLAELRKDHGLTQEGLAKVLGISKHTIASYEQNKSAPDDATKVRIAKQFNRSLDYLLGATDLEIALVRKESVELPVGFPQELIAEVERHITLLHESHLHRQSKKSPAVTKR